MAVLYVTEFAALASVQQGMIGQVPAEPPLADQTVAIGAGHAESTAFNGTTTIVRFHSDTVCSIVIGASPVANATNGRMAANQTEYRSVPRGASFKVSVIQNT